MNKAADAQLEAEAAYERAEKTERTAIESRQSNRDLLERLRNLEHRSIGHAQAGAISAHDTQGSGDPDHGA